MSEYIDKHTSIYIDIDIYITRGDRIKRTPFLYASKQSADIHRYIHIYRYMKAHIKRQAHIKANSKGGGKYARQG